MKTSPCIEQPLTPHFYIVKLRFTGVYIFFLFLLQNIINVLSKNKKNIIIFHLKIIIFSAMKYRCILHGHVCVMIYHLVSLMKGHRKFWLVLQDVL